MSKNYTVTELSSFLKSNITELLSFFTLTGEIYDLKITQNHLYFCLKDSKSIIKVIIWSFNSNVDKTMLKNGLVIEAFGNLAYYDKSGSISFIINRFVIINDEGLLIKKMNTWKSIYEKKGYFINKLQIPTYINDIVIITSKEGAALQDFLYVLKNNNYQGKYTILDSTVQGDRCVKDVCDAIQSSLFMKPQLVIITRGGGSLEDLVNFSDPAILEALYQLRENNICSLTAIGHEINNMLCDLVSDVRCSTPSLAAEFIISHNKIAFNELLQSMTIFVYQEKQNVVELLESIKPTKKVNEIISEMKQFCITEKEKLQYYLNEIKLRYHQESTFILEKVKSLINNEKLLIINLNSQLKDIENNYYHTLELFICELYSFINEEKHKLTQVQLVDKNELPMDLSCLEKGQLFDGYIYQNNIKYSIQFCLQTHAEYC